MSNRRMIFWLFSIAVAVVFANFLLMWQTPAARPMTRRFLLDPTFDVKSVSIERLESPRTDLSRIDGNWELVSPYAGEVDAQTVLRLIDGFMCSMANDTLSEAELSKLGRTRSDFGLEHPRMRVSFSNAVESVEIAFGDFTPMSNEVYAVRSGSEAVYAVPSTVFDAADVSADSFRQRAVFPYEPGFVASFDVKKPDETVLSFTRDGESWRLGSNAASVPKVSEFLTILSDAKAGRFVWPTGATNEASVASSALLAGYGLDPDSAVVVSLHCGDGGDRRLLLGRNVDQTETYALIRGGEAIVTLPIALKTAALQNVQTFADTRLFPLAESAVASFSISDGATSYVVARESGNSWRLDAPVTAVADAKFASSVLGRILALTPADIDSSGLKVTVSTNHPSFFVSARSLLGKGRLDDLRSCEILKVDAALVRRLVLTNERLQKTVSLVRQRERQTWTIESEHKVGCTVRTASVEKILMALSSLQALRIETMKAGAADLARFGLDNPRYTLAIDQEKEGSVRRNIMIGAATKDGSYATVGSSEAVFVLPKKTVSVLTDGLIDE